jgi:hypothetical protein
MIYRIYIGITYLDDITLLIEPVWKSHHRIHELISPQVLTLHNTAHIHIITRCHINMHDDDDDEDDDEAMTRFPHEYLIMYHHPMHESQVHWIYEPTKVS